MRYRVFWWLADEGEHGSATLPKLTDVNAWLFLLQRRREITRIFAIEAGPVGPEAIGIKCADGAVYCIQEV